MNRLTTRLALLLAILAAGYLAAGCAQGGNFQDAVSTLSPARSLTASPPTFSPRTRSPRPTREPATVQPTTAPAVPVPAPSSEASAAPSPSAEPSGSGSSYLWLWIVLGVIVLVIVAALIARHSGRRSANAASWRSKVVDARARGSALYDAISMAEAPGAAAARDGSARRADIQRRADDLTQVLYGLRETAPGEAERAQVADVLGSLQALRSAMDAEYAAGGAGTQQGVRVDYLLRSFDASLRDLR